MALSACVAGWSVVWVISVQPSHGFFTYKIVDGITLDEFDLTERTLVTDHTAHYFVEAQTEVSQAHTFNDMLTNRVICQLEISPCDYGLTVGYIHHAAFAAERKTQG